MNNRKSMTQVNLSLSPTLFFSFYLESWKLKVNLSLLPVPYKRLIDGLKLRENDWTTDNLTNNKLKDVIQLTLTLKMSTAQVVESSVTVNNIPSQDYLWNDCWIQTFYSYNKSVILQRW